MRYGLSEAYHRDDTNQSDERRSIMLAATGATITTVLVMAVGLIIMGVAIILSVLK